MTDNGACYYREPSPVPASGCTSITQTGALSKLRPHVRTTWLANVGSEPQNRVQLSTGFQSYGNSCWAHGFTKNRLSHRSKEAKPIIEEKPDNINLRAGDHQSRRAFVARKSSASTSGETALRLCPSVVHRQLCRGPACRALTGLAASAVEILGQRTDQMVEDACRHIGRE